MGKLVSILTSCYNGAKYIKRYADSLLAQDYNNCQLIFMDDGSTDDTKRLIHEYNQKFIDKGYSFEYHWHENKGIGGTIADGLKYVNGDYLIWPDVDDILTPDSISKKVAYLERRKDVGVVRTRYCKFFENTDEKQVGPQDYVDSQKENLFEDYLLTQGAVWLQPGCFMIRMSAFDDANPNRYIYPTRRGQNWQILLPVLYKYKCGFLDEPLYLYAIHSGSLSDESNDTLETIIQRYDMYEELLVATINHMNIPDFEKYSIMLHNHYLEEKLGVALRYSDCVHADVYYNELKDNNALSAKARIKYALVKHPITYKILRKIKKQ